MNLRLKNNLRRMRSGQTDIELGCRYSTADLEKNLHWPEKIVYRVNGNRAVRPSALIKSLKPVMNRVGITRIGNLTDLSAAKFPVFQACRPNVFYHTEIGQNTGSQGKGELAEQALISCVMEAIEGYCSEPRCAALIRGSYRFLKGQHVLLNPRHMHALHDVKAVSETEPIMWTPAYSISQKCEVLIPAQSVYYPFVPTQYRTASHFPCSSNGLASGATYLEAINHGLYELIERHYLACAEEGLCTVRALQEDELKSIDMSRLSASLQGQYEFQLYSFQFKSLRKKNMPFIYCLIVGDDEMYSGLGCFAEIDVAISRAVSEALQTLATCISGAREDIATPEKVPRKNKLRWPSYRSLSYASLKSQVLNYRFRDLNEEFEFLVSWLRDLGHSEVYIANLTRAGVEVPVVKVMVPSLRSYGAIRKIGRRWDAQETFNRQFK